MRDYISAWPARQVVFCVLEMSHHENLISKLNELAIDTYTANLTHAHCTQF